MESDIKKLEVQTFKLGEMLPKREFDTIYIYPVYEQGIFNLQFSTLSGVVTIREFPSSDKGGTFKRIGLQLREKSPDGKIMELIFPSTVYDGILVCMERYKERLLGVEISKTGEGKQGTRYRVFPVI